VPQPHERTGSRAAGQNKAKVLEALKRGPMTAADISEAKPGTASTLLTNLAKAARSPRPNAATSCRTNRTPSFAARHHPSSREPPGAWRAVLGA